MATESRLPALPQQRTGEPDLQLLHGGLTIRQRPAPAGDLEVRPHPLAGKHVVVIGINYAPEKTGIAPYTTGVAEYLARHAGSVTVLTGMPHYPSWQVTEEYRGALRRQERPSMSAGSDLLVHRLRHYVPARQTAMRRAAYEATFLAHAATAPVPHDAGLVVAVTPSLGGAIAGARLARRSGARLLVVVQDLMAKAACQSGISGGGRVGRLTAKLERDALMAADRVAVVSESFRAPLIEYGIPEERISLLPNWTHVATTTRSRLSARRSLGWPTDPFTVVHTGNIGLKQDLGNVVEAARLCADGGIRFVLVGDGSQRAAIRARAAGLPNVAFVDPLGDADYVRALAAADVLLVNERPSVGDMSLPSKLTSYLSAGRPVLAAVGVDSATARELAHTHGAAYRVDPGEPGAIARALREMREYPAGLARMAEAGRSYARTELGRDVAMRRLDALVGEVLR